MGEGAIRNPRLPTGTVTFFFSDIEGSTKLLNRLGADYPAVLEKHQGLLREAFAAADGVEVATEGDSFFVVFPRAPQAVAAAVTALRALAGHGWPEGVEVRVRIGLHTGEGILGGDNYVGLDLHRAARIAAAAHGGQIVVSAPTRALVEHSLPEGATLRDLGEHRLKDLAHPEHLFQVVAEGLPTEFPPPRSLDARPTNLPQQLTTFVGRHRELHEVRDALEQTRLLTLTGPGGTGKTRLSLQVAAEVLDRFEHGVFVVALAPITDPELVIPTVAQVLGVPEEPARSPTDTVADHLRDRELLLVLDNFEQVTAAAPRVGELLGAADRIKVLVTSREPLGLHGEREYPVPPLGVPDVDHLPSLATMSQYEAVSLFIDRARAVNPRFAVTDENAPAVAEITARLDGLPLAIELAAARSKILSPQAMLKRLEHRLTLLAGGARDLPGRQQTLRDAIAWSYDLLEEDERTLFARLAVFVGGFSLEAVEAVCNPSGDLGLDAFEAVASLVNKSLLRQVETEEGEPRFFMLETIREYAVERLGERRDADEVRARHAAYHLELAERAGSELTGERQVEFLEALAREHANLRAALDWAEDRGALDLAYRTAAALWRFWQMRGHLREARERLERLLAMAGGSVGPRAEALEAAGGIVYWMGDFDAAGRFYEESLRLRREMGDRPGEAEALYNLSFVYHVPPPPRGDLDRATELLEASHEIFKSLGDQAGLAKVTWAVGNVYFRRQDLDRAETSLRESLEANRAIGDRFGEGWSTHTLGVALLAKGVLDEAGELFRRSLEMFAGAGDLSGIALLLADFAALAFEEGHLDRAARLAGAAHGVQDRTGVDMASFTLTEPYWLERLRRTHEEPQLKEAFEEGGRMPVDDAVAYALEGRAEDRPDATGG